MSFHKAVQGLGTNLYRHASGTALAGGLSYFGGAQRVTSGGFANMGWQPKRAPSVFNMRSINNSGYAMGGRSGFFGGVHNRGSSYLGRRGNSIWR